MEPSVHDSQTRAVAVGHLADAGSAYVSSRLISATAAAAATASNPATTNQQVAARALPRVD